MISTRTVGREGGGAYTAKIFLSYTGHRRTCKGVFIWGNKAGSRKIRAELEKLLDIPQCHHRIMGFSIASSVAPLLRRWILLDPALTSTNGSEDGGR
jgi:hypothetical protein